MRLAIPYAFAAAVLSVAAPAAAGEGMWTFDGFPTQRVNRELGTQVDAAWLSRVQAGAVRLAGGCSASLVSPEGLVLTNQHCVRSCVQTFSTPENDVLAKGFSTQGREEERACPGQQAEVLLAIEDVTAQVAAAGRGRSGQAFVQARDAAIGAIEKAACGGDATLRCQVVTLHRGGQYKLHRFRKYSDVRMVWTPEHQAVVFGGDPDNFNFPRYALDAAFLRVYENGRPAATPAYLRWTPRAPREGEPVFVVGNPGSTSRLKTVAQLEAERDRELPAGIKRLSELRGRMIAFADASDDNRRISRDALRGVENSLKSTVGRHVALADRRFMEERRRNEARFLERTGDSRAAVARAAMEIAAAQDAAAELSARYDWLEGGAGQGSALWGYARTLVRAADERAKPAGQRLPEYGESRMALLEKRLLDARRIEPALEELYLRFWLSKTREALGTDAGEVQALLGRESPEALAARLVAGSKLADPAFRRALWEGGPAAVRASTDPLIQLALRADGDARRIRNLWEERVEGPTDRNGEILARARFQAFGDATYPDATFSPRISFGRIEGWTEAGRPVPAITRVAGLWARATGAPPFDLAPRLAAARERLDPQTVYTVATSNDIVGGNSGSPLLDAEGRVIGAVFDGNLPSLGGAYGYNPANNRAVAVSAQAVQETLLKVYDQARLVAELNAAPR